MFRIQEAIVVEGRYDKNTLSQLVDTVILETSGFGVFQNAELVALLRRLARTRGLIVLTDSDGAGFLIRGHLKSALPAQMCIRDRARAARCSTSPQRHAAAGTPSIPFAAGGTESPRPSPHRRRPASGGQSGVFALAAKAARCSTPKRCCSSATTRPSRRKATGPDSKAWVPTTKSISPASRAA